MNIIDIIWMLLPSYFANASPVLIKGKTPIDFKIKFCGNRLLGDGKTIEGFISGFISGIFIGLIQIYIQNFYNFGFKHNIFTIFFLSFFAVFGDLLGSFIKRRLNLPRGFPFPILDQLDFVFIPLIYFYLVNIISLNDLILAFLMTFSIHVIMNCVAYILKLKKEPW
jgi:CDP-2,3-bis-(O-geranylgeranyl)-sn-glycerol synthase